MQTCLPMVHGRQTRCDWELTEHRLSVRQATYVITNDYLAFATKGTDKIVHYAAQREYLFINMPNPILSAYTMLMISESLFIMIKVIHYVPHNQVIDYIPHDTLTHYTIHSWSLFKATHKLMHLKNAWVNNRNCSNKVMTNAWNTNSCCIKIN